MSRDRELLEECRKAVLIMKTADNLVKKLQNTADQQFQVNLCPMPKKEKSSTLKEVLKIG